MICLVHRGKVFASACGPFVPYLLFQCCTIASLRLYTVLSIAMGKTFSWIYQQVKKPLSPPFWEQIIICTYFAYAKLQSSRLRHQFGIFGDKSDCLGPGEKKDGCFRRLLPSSQLSTRSSRSIDFGDARPGHFSLRVTWAEKRLNAA